MKKHTIAVLSMCTLCKGQSDHNSGGSHLTPTTCFGSASTHGGWQARREDLCNYIKVFRKSDSPHETY